MNSMRGCKKHLENKERIVCAFLSVMLILSACAESNVYENCEEAKTENVISVTEPYSYEVEKEIFSFSASEDKTYHIPYAKISGCPDKKLQWNINHTLWKEAGWILDCAAIGVPLYELFCGENAMDIVGIYQYKQYLSILYEGAEESRLPGKIGYAIVIDTLDGSRILLGDVIENEDKFQDMLIHYFDNDPREVRLFIFEEDAEKILCHGRMTEKETVLNNVTFNGKYPEEDNGEIDSISYLFESASFYMSEEGFVVLPGAEYYEPLVFGWEEMVEVIKDEYRHLETNVSCAGTDKKETKTSEKECIDDEILKYLKMPIQEILDMTNANMDVESGVVVFEPDVFFPYIEEAPFLIICRSSDTTYKPLCISLYQDYDENYLQMLELNHNMGFREIMEAMGTVSVGESSERAGDKRYMISYIDEDLQYYFCSDNRDGREFELFIGLAE